MLQFSASKDGNAVPLQVPLMLPIRARMKLETLHAGIGEELLDRATVTQNATYYIEDKAPGWLATFAKEAQPDGSFSRTKFEDIKKRLRSLFNWVEDQVILFQEDNLRRFLTKNELRKAFPSLEQNEFETVLEKYDVNGDNGLGYNEFYRIFGLRFWYSTAW